MKRFRLCFSLLGVVLLSSTAPLPLGTAQAQDQTVKEEIIEKAPPNDIPAQPEEPPRRPRRKQKERMGMQRHNAREIVQFGKDVVVAKDETKQNVVVIAGDAKIDGDVDQDVVVISGSAEVNGTVNGSLVVILGSLKMGPDAQVRQEVVVIGGPIEQDDTAMIDGERILIGLTHTLPNFTWLQQWLSKGLLLARPLPPQFLWVWGVAGLFLLMYLMLAMLFPKPVQASVVALQERPMGSFFTGALVLLLFGPLVFLLVVSIAGILVIPFLICATVLAFLFGTAAVYSYTGQQVMRQSASDGTKVMLMVLVGAILFYVLYMIPILGFVAWGVVTVLGLGAVVLAGSKTFRREENPAYTSAPPVIVTGAAATTAGAALPGAETLPATEIIVMQRVGFWCRFMATFLDFILLCMLITLTGPAFLLLWAAYHVAMWTWKGTTIGGIVMGIKIVRLNGAPVNFSVALVRSLSSFFSALVLFLGFFWAGWDRDKQAWHDKIAGTLVVRVPKGMSLI